MTTSDAHSSTLASWTTNAAFWDSYMGSDGNLFVTHLELPSLHSLLSPLPGEHALDLATGNGLVARWLKDKGCVVSATDGSAEMVRLARERVGEGVKWGVTDLTDDGGLGTLGKEAAGLRGFDMISLNMAIIFVATILHPAFMTQGASRRIEAVEDPIGNRGFEYKYSVDVQRYLDIPPGGCRAVREQPVEGTYFHRPLHTLLAPFFAAGLVLDGLEEPGFKAKALGGENEGWDMFSQIPPILAFRLRWLG